MIFMVMLRVMSPTICATLRQKLTEIGSGENKPFGIIKVCELLFPMLYVLYQKDTWF